MRLNAVFACLVSFGLLVACVPASNLPVAPDPKPTPTSAADTNADTNAFPRLANPQPGQSLEIAEYFADPANGVKVQQVTVTRGAETASDGSVDYQVQSKVDMGDQGVHDVEIAEVDAPPGSDKPDVFTVTDKTDASTFVFELSADATRAVIRQGEASLSLTLAGDETVSLDDQAPVNVDIAALQALDAMFKEKVSPHALALLYSRLIRSPGEEAQAYRMQSGASAGMLHRGFYELLVYLIFLHLRGSYMPLDSYVTPGLTRGPGERWIPGQARNDGRRHIPATLC